MARLEKLRVLNQDAVLKVHENSLKILEETGVRLYSDEALGMFFELGLPIEAGKRVVRIPRDIIEQCLKTVPREIKLYDRGGTLCAELGAGNVYTASGHNAIYVLDFDSRERRAATKEDVGRFALLSDCLPDIDIVGVEAMPQDVNAEFSLVHAVDAVFNNTEKHVFFSPDTKEVLLPIFEMAEVVMDGGNLGAKSPVTCQLSPTSPLLWEKGAVEALIETTRRGIPLCILPQPFAGVSSPYTLAGLLTVHNAEMLSGIVFSQLINPGSPVIYGSAWSTFDMRTMNVVIGSPETVLLRIAGSQMAEFYHVPYHTIAPDTDAHALDEQLAWEKFATTWGAYLALSDLMVNGGLFSTGLTVSFEQLLIDHEIFSYIKRLSAGIHVSEDTLALDAIQRVGPKGSYLDDEHTMKYLRSEEHWEPMVSVREIYEDWREGGEKDVVVRAKEKVDSIFQDHQVAELSTEKQKEIQRIIRNAENSQ
jgi:trimethylamine--corrinoid protein Co-methyltransferase